MPQVLNPYYQAPTDQITPAISNIVKAFLSAPSPAERALKQAQADAASALALKNQADAAQTTQQMNAPRNIADTVQRYYVDPPPEMARPDPGFAGPMPQMDRESYVRQALPNMVRYGTEAKQTGSSIADTVRMLAANMGLSGPAVQNSIIGAGGGQSQMQAFDMTGMNAADRRVATLGQAAYGANEGQVKGAKLAENFGRMSLLPPNEQKALGGLPAPQNYVLPDGRKGVTLDGTTDAATGEPLGQGPQVFKNVDPSTPKSVQADLAKSQISRKRFIGVMGYVKSLSDNPANFGLPGWIKDTAQDVAIVTQGMSSAMGYEKPNDAVRDVRQKVAQMHLNPELLGGVFDPSLPALHTAADLLVFSAAEALANQSGRSVSDKDIQFFKGVVGDPKSFFMSKEKFQAKLATLNDLVSQLNAADTGKPGAAPGGSGQADPLGIRY